ncbi:histidine phosphatase family protein [Variovorax arabinosiphilus]|uniref:histidine phosphatase family protein n=1 Tax=Variovorax arabinosiphilus TaxID=3053498 RepID=UPI0025769B4C|nr:MULTISPECIES: histidine phosphatase family protein [unclassified Variovorax]MDM0119180.1 histidine phosphatase family protein [Variovorax sp. J2L1-78]MDM0129606.1 histidine phosphatase family protein [Variovorax sp. J2L1-63]MDM0232608.1 histidine phosphatase family protein [Variovorax sp. J2R1-6]
MSTLWLLRHAPVDAPAGLCYGRTDLSCVAEATQAVAATIAPLLPVDIVLYSSPLQRCATLARAIADQRPTLSQATIDPRLAEMDFGAWEGQPWDRIARADFDAWMSDFAEARAGTHGESTRLFMGRVGEAWDAWRASRRDALWVTHAGVMRAVTLLQQGVRCPADAGAWPRRPIGFGEWVTVEV